MNRIFASDIQEKSMSFKLIHTCVRQSKKKKITPKITAIAKMDITNDGDQYLSTANLVMTDQRSQTLYS